MVHDVERKANSKDKVIQASRLYRHEGGTFLKESTALLLAKAEPRKTSD
jgi:hypothetical protein